MKLPPPYVLLLAGIALLSCRAGEQAPRAVGPSPPRAPPTAHASEPAPSAKDQGPSPEALPEPPGRIASDGLSIPDESKSAPVIRCSSKQGFELLEQRGQRLRLVRRTLDGTNTSVVADEQSSSQLALSSDGAFVAGSFGVKKRDTGEPVLTSAANDWGGAFFLSGTHTLIVEAPTEEILIAHLDSTPPRVERIRGYGPKPAWQGAFVYLEAETSADPEQPADSPPRLTAVSLRSRAGRNSALLKKVVMNEVTYNVTEAVALEKGHFFYRVYDEHEYRYYDERSRPLNAGERYNVEQFDLATSFDGKRLVLAERLWNELTTIVVFEEDSTRKELPFYGSFPQIYGDWVVFTSDPSFVRAPAHEPFRQIEKFALFAWDTKNAALCLIDEYPDFVMATAPTAP